MRITKNKCALFSILLPMSAENAKYLAEYDLLAQYVDSRNNVAAQLIFCCQKTKLLILRLLIESLFRKFDVLASTLRFSDGKIL